VTTLINYLSFGVMTFVLALFLAVIFKKIEKTLSGFISGFIARFRKTPPASVNPVPAA
jgi:ABC-type arginine/histidine transport system permease subunit